MSAILTGNNTDLDPLEQMIYDVFQQTPVLVDLFGQNVYFDWNTDPQGLPYARIVDAGAGPQMYTMPPTDADQRTVVTRPRKQFSIFSLDRSILISTLLPTISNVFEAKKGIFAYSMKGGDDTCNQILMRTPWQKKFDQQSRSVLQANIWHGFAIFDFTVQRIPGVL